MGFVEAVDAVLLGAGALLVDVLCVVLGGAFAVVCVVGSPGRPKKYQSNAARTMMGMAHPNHLSDPDAAVAAAVAVAPAARAAGGGRTSRLRSGTERRRGRRRSGATAFTNSGGGLTGCVTQRVEKMRPAELSTELVAQAGRECCRDVLFLGCEQLRDSRRAGAALRHRLLDCSHDEGRQHRQHRGACRLAGSSECAHRRRERFLLSAQQRAKHLRAFVGKRCHPLPRRGGSQDCPTSRSLLPPPRASARRQDVQRLRVRLPAGPAPLR